MIRMAIGAAIGYFAVGHYAGEGLPEKITLPVGPPIDTRILGAIAGVLVGRYLL